MGLITDLTIVKATMQAALDLESDISNSELTGCREMKIIMPQIILRSLNTKHSSLYIQ